MIFIAKLGVGVMSTALRLVRDYGFDDVLPKPWTLAQLSEVCRRVLTADRQHKSKELP